MSGTHGTGIKYGNMATLVAEIEIISAQGIMYRASERENHDIFKATLVGLGILGVITEVTLHCVPAFNLHEVITVIPLEECLNNLNHLIHRSDHVKLWFEFHTRMVQVYSTNKTTLPRRDVPSSFILNMQVYKTQKQCEIYSFILFSLPFLSISSTSYRGFQV
jgi:L-gulonolactone oxidase